MTKIRVKVRLGKEDSGQVRKIVRFDPSIELAALIDQIAAKLGVTSASSRGRHANKEMRLMLGSAVLENADEIDDDDELALVIVESDGKVEKEKSAEEDGTVVNESPDEEEDEEDGDDESYVEDVTDEVMRQRKKTQEDEAVQLDDDDDDVDDDDDDESDSEESWPPSDDEDESSEEGSDKDSYEDSVDDIKKRGQQEIPDRKRKRVGGAVANAANATAVGRRKKCKPKAPPEPPLEVIMKQKDTPNAPGTKPDNENDGSTMEEASCLTAEGNSRNGVADKAVKDRIIKLLNTGFHDTSNENEAKNAMKLAQRLMRKYDLSQALLLKEREERNNNSKGDEDEVLKGGLVEVKIVNRKTRKPAQLARWISYLATPISENFGVESFYSTGRGRSSSVTFYGIYTNAQLAAYAFKVATERISQMSAQYVPSPLSRVSTKSSRLSYALGIVFGIQKEVDETIKREKEEKQRKLEKARRAVSTGEAYEDSDDDNDDGDETGGYSFPDNHQSSDASPSEETNASPVLSTSGGKEESVDTTEHSDAVAPASVSPDPAETTIHNDSTTKNQEILNKMEQEEEAALVLIDHREKVAEKVLEDNGIKVRKSRRKSRICFDRRSYQKGVEDSKEIDINQRAIRDEVRFKREPKTET